MVKSVSATQLKQFRSCALQWYLQRVEGWEYPQTGSQALGEKTHGQIERYMLEGTKDELFPSVQAAIAKGLVPAFGLSDGRVVEEPSNYVMEMTLADVPVKGRIDLLLPPAEGSTLVRVVDWKTCSSFNYTPSPDVLTRDVQGVLYLRYAFERYPWATEGQFRHVYLLTKGTGAKKVDAEVVTPAWNDGQWRHLEQTVEEMKATATRPLPVVAVSQASLNHCDAYGGCKFRDRCPAASKGLIASMFEIEAVPESGPAAGEDMTTLADKLKARRAATSGTPVPAPEITVTVPIPVADSASEPAPVDVLPPDAPKAAFVKEENDTPPMARKTEVVEVKKSKTRRPFEKAEAPAAPVVVAPTVVETAPVVVAPAITPDVAKAADDVREAWVAEGEKRPLTLFVDCYPEKGFGPAPHSLEDEIAARTPSILEHLRKSSPKDVPEGAVDLGEVLFGRGYSTLSASFVLKPVTGPWTVTSYFPASGKVLEVLTTKAMFVVRGRR